MCISKILSKLFPITEPDNGDDVVPVANRIVKVAVLDTGCSQKQALNVRLPKIRSFVDGTPIDKCKHGSKVIDIILQAPNTNVVSIKIAVDPNTVWPSDVAMGIDFAVYYGCDMINMSFVCPVNTDKLEQAVENASFHGAILVAGAGNDLKVPVWPAAYDQVIAVTNKSKYINLPWVDELYECESSSWATAYVTRDMANQLGFMVVDNITTWEEYENQIHNVQHHIKIRQEMPNG